MSAARSSALYSLDLAGAGRTLVFGLHWFVLIGRHIQAMALARARRLRATHYVAGGLRASAGGCARLPPALRKRPVYAAAQVFAQLHADAAVACIAALPDGRYWLVAAQDAAVITRTDRIYDSHAQARQELDALLAERPSLQVCDGAVALQAVMTGSGEPARLLLAHSRWKSLPWPARLCLFLLALAGVVWLLDKNRKPAPAPVALSVQAPDPEQQWQQQVQDFKRKQHIHGVADLQRVFFSLYRLPLNVQGWVLRSAQCQADAQAWACSATYGRADPLAINADFFTLAPNGWAVSFQALDAALLSWRVPIQSASLLTASLPSAGLSINELGSLLQRLQPAFTQVLLGEAGALMVSSPQDGASRALPIRQRSLSLHGPLRSYALLVDYADRAAAAWTTLALRVEPGRRPDIAASVLTVHLQGWVYEQE